MLRIYSSAKSHNYSLFAESETGSLELIIVQLDDNVD